MAKKNQSFTEKYELTVEPTTIITRAPDRQRIDLRRLTMEQADKLYASPGQSFLKKKSAENEKTA